MEKLKDEGSQEKAFIKDTSWCGVSFGSNTSVVDVKNGKIIRIRPLRYDWKYKPEEFNPWKIVAFGTGYSHQIIY